MTSDPAFDCDLPSPAALLTPRAARALLRILQAADKPAEEKAEIKEVAA
jgi:hypothetical protein